jgi:hypothetical protein
LGEKINLERKIKVYITGTKGTEVKEVSLAEAGKILKDTYADPVGGLVANKKTGEIIWKISRDVEEILVIDQIIGGG